jgi:nucleolar MIF4G domain-containing protein 1
MLTPVAVRAHEPLRMSLADLRSADTRGRWWLVGAAWGGDPLVDRQAPDASGVAQAPARDEPPAESALLALARKQGMNTDIRTSVFVVLMSSDVRARQSQSVSETDGTHT